MTGFDNALDPLFPLCGGKDCKSVFDDVHGSIEQSVVRTFLQPLLDLRISRRGGIHAALARNAQHRIMLGFGHGTAGPGDLHHAAPGTAQAPCRSTRPRCLTRANSSGLSTCSFSPRARAISSRPAFSRNFASSFASSRRKKDSSIAFSRSPRKRSDIGCRVMMRGNTPPSGKTPAARRRNAVRQETPFFLRLCLVEFAYGISAACRASMDELQASQSDEGSSPTPLPTSPGTAFSGDLCAARRRQLAGASIRSRPLRRRVLPASCDLTFRPTKGSSDSLTAVSAGISNTELRPGRCRLARQNPFAIAFGAVVLSLASPSIAQAPRSWDGLVQVKSKQLKLVYLQPGADFRSYTKVIVEPTEVAFAKDWQRITIGRPHSRRGLATGTSRRPSWRVSARQAISSSKPGRKADIRS